jgi:hypothetical protein
MAGSFLYSAQQDNFAGSLKAMWRRSSAASAIVYREFLIEGARFVLSPARHFQLDKKDVRIPAETRLSFRLARPFTITVKD